jgi:hypothetical protein
VVIACGGCTGVIDAAGNPGGVGKPHTGGPSGEEPGAGDSSGGGGGPMGGAGPGAGGASGSSPGAAGDGGSSTGQSNACAKAGLLPGPAPLARLTTAEYTNTIRDLFPTLTLPLDQYTLPAEIATEGFLNNAATQAPSAEVIEALAMNAHAIATTAAASLDSVLPCHPTTKADETSCGHQFITEFGQSAFRRPLDAAEVDRYEAFFDDAYGQWGMKDAARMVVEAMLQSPPFLYRLEVGSPPVDGAVQLTSREMASRLSYFLTDSMPDASLRDAADNDELLDPAALEREARRLLGSDAAREAVAAFNAQWLRFDKMDALTKAPDLFPSFSEDVATSMRQATRQYVDRLFWDQGRTLEALLTDHSAYVDARLAPIYGVSAPSGGAMSLVDVGADRSGILTQAGLLAGFAHERSDAPVLRGVFVLDRLLCSTPPPPPAGVNTALPVLSTDAHQTTRQQLEQSHVASSCATCHDAIDGIGFGFEHFDAVGQWRTTDLGIAVDDSGELRGTDIDGPFHGAVELGQKLASSQQVRRCVSTQVLRYALAVTRTEVKPCMVDGVARAFDASGEDLSELLVAVVKSDAFRYRPAD